MFASGFSLLTPKRSLSSPFAPHPRSVCESTPVFPDVPGATGGHGGPLTVRQRFLLGKRVDVNRAGILELSGLPGISDPMAREIARERARRGGFRRPEDLLAVRGIKEKRLKKILPFIAIFPNN
jgi:competence protein ComEA